MIHPNNGSSSEDNEDKESNWIEFYLYFIEVNRCEICNEVKSIYKWPKGISLNDSSSGCLTCLHKYNYHLSKAEQLRSVEFFNGKPVLRISIDTSWRRRGRFDCARCNKVFYGIERITGHWKFAHKDNRFYE